MSLSKHAGLTDPIKFSMTEATAAEVTGTGEATEALALTADGAESVNFTYSATAEDNGTAGDLDGEPGVIYRGEATKAVRVSFRDVDILEGAITAPGAGDAFTVGIYKNSTLVAHSDEGFVSLVAETASEQNLDTVVDAVAEGDVIRVVLQADAESEVSDIDVAAGGVVVID